MLIYTGFKRTAHDIASSYVNKLQKSKKKDILEILSFVYEAEKVLKLLETEKGKSLGEIEIEGLQQKMEIFKI